MYIFIYLYIYIFIYFIIYIYIYIYVYIYILYTHLLGYPTLTYTHVHKKHAPPTTCRYFPPSAAIQFWSWILQCTADRVLCMKMVMWSIAGWMSVHSASILGWRRRRNLKTSTLRWGLHQANLTFRAASRARPTPAHGVGPEFCEIRLRDPSFYPLAPEQLVIHVTWIPQRQRLCWLQLLPLFPPGPTPFSYQTPHVLACFPKPTKTVRLAKGNCC